MSQLKVESTTNTNLTNTVEDFSVDSRSITDVGPGGTYYNSPNWNRNLGYYMDIPELKKAIDAFVDWTVGLGFNASPKHRAIIEHITGNGKENFLQIMKNLLIVKKINGDAFAEIIWADMEKQQDLVNLKPLNPQRVRVHYDESGMIDFYEEYDVKKKRAIRKIKPENMFHLINDKVANSIGGAAVIDACKWIIDARNEAMSDVRRVMHRSTIRVIEVDADNETRLNTLTSQYANAIKNGEVLIVPKDNVGFPDVPGLSTTEQRDWIAYLENAFYLAVGVPKIIMGGSQDYTEAASKMGILTFEQPHMSERKQLEDELWNQLQLRVDFDEPVSIKEDIQTSEAANTGQVQFQPKDFEPTVGRNN